MICAAYIPYTHWVYSRPYAGIDWADVRVTAEGDVYAYAQCMPHQLLPDLLIRIIVPSLIMLICNIVILVIVCRSRKNAASNHSNIGSVTAMLLFVTFFHLGLIILPYILTLPLLIEYGTSYGMGSSVLFTTIWCLMYLDQSLNFLLYSASRQDVRSEIKQLFKCNKGNYNEVTDHALTEMPPI